VDQRLRELERRWRATGSRPDELAFLHERLRTATERERRRLAIQVFEPETLRESLVRFFDLGPDVRGVDALKVLLEANDMSASDLSNLLGDRSRSLGSRVLRGERELSKAHIRALCERFAVSAELFV